MNNIKFSHNWNNKLNHYIFTTIRKYTEDKFSYYCHQLGHNFNVILDSKTICNAELIAIETLEFINAPRGLLHVDTGLVDSNAIYTLFRQFGINESTTIIVLTFKNRGTNE